MENKEQKEKLESMRHSLAHIMMQAITRLYPDAVPAVGPYIENGFYHDFDSSHSVSDDDLKKIEKEMKNIIKKNLPIEKEIKTFEEADKYFDEKKYIYTKEFANELKEAGEENVTFYKQGEFMNMCKGPHVESTKKVGAFRLIKVAGAYWRGDEKNKMLQRVYGVAFETREKLEEHLHMLEEAKKRDHRKLGKELDLFFIDPVVGLGLPLWYPKGALMWRIVEDFWYEEHLKAGYDLVRSPHIGSKKLWETSGHWNFYNDSMYPPLEIGSTLEDYQEGKEKKAKESYLIKPMNCPFHVQIYKSKPHSYRDFPLRWAECGTVYRYEKSGELSGLTRVRGFTQDDAHIICRKEQVKEELKRVLDFIVFVFSTFGFDEYKVYLSLRDPNNKEKYAGDDAGWDFTQSILEEVAIEKKLDFVKEEGEAAFYGPKLDFKVKDSLGREWQCSTLQFDFNLPERFDMTFINEKGEEERPYMLHRALFGSFERFMGVLIEHYAGKFPLWFSPVQIKLIPVGEGHVQFAKELADKFRQKLFRVEVDADAETVGKKVRKASKEKVPYILVIGDKEIESGNLNVRVRGQENDVEMDVEKFMDLVSDKIKTKAKDLV